MSEHLQELARQVRNTTLRHLEAAEDNWLTWAPQGTANHILWHAGHALWLGDVLCLAPLELSRRPLPDGWAETFGMKCRPVATTTDWPTRSEVATLLREQLGVILEMLTNHRDHLADSTEDTTRQIIHGFHDEALHGGEMYLLLKLCRSGHA